MASACIIMLDAERVSVTTLQDGGVDLHRMLQCGFYNATRSQEK